MAHEDATPKTPEHPETHEEQNHEAARREEGELDEGPAVGATVEPDDDAAQATEPAEAAEDDTEEPEGEAEKPEDDAKDSAAEPADAENPDSSSNGAPSPKDDADEAEDPEPDGADGEPGDDASSETDDAANVDASELDADATAADVEASEQAENSANADEDDAADSPVVVSDDSTVVGDEGDPSDSSAVTPGDEAPSDSSAVAGDEDAPNPDEPEAAGPDLSAAAAGLIDAARSATQTGAKSINEGITAMREVSRAKRAHAEARERLEELHREVEETQAELNHRREVEENYDDIIRVQHDEISAAAQALSDAQTREARATGEHDAKASELKKLKADNERRLAPYRKLMEGAKGTLTDAEHAQSEAKRALKTAQAQLDAATNSRDTRVASATRTVDTAASKLQRLQDQFAEMKRTPTTTAKEQSEVSGAIAAALAQLENAREDAARTTAETTQAVEISQTHLYTQRKSLEEAQADLDAAAEEERGKREEFERLRKEADVSEKKFAEEVEELAKAIKGAREAQATARGRTEAASALIEEAESIHANPAATERLARGLNAAQGEAERQAQLVDTLAAEMRETRERTHEARTSFLVIVGIVVVVLLVILWLVLR